MVSAKFVAQAMTILLKPFLNHHNMTKEHVNTSWTVVVARIVPRNVLWRN